MIGHLRGTLLTIEEDQIVLDVNGVGYELTVSGSVLGAGRAVGEQVSLVVYTDVKENAINLFGFQERLEKQVFLLLKKVKGIGSRIAMNIVSAIGAEALLSTIGRGDIAELQQVPGIGKKTAERLILELREQVQKLPAEVSAARSAGGQAPRPTAQKQPANGAQADAVLALEKLGFSEERARTAVQDALAAAGSASDAGELLREALARM